MGHVRHTPAPAHHAHIGWIGIAMQVQLHQQQLLSCPGQGMLPDDHCWLCLSVALAASAVGVCVRTCRDPKKFYPYTR